MDRGPWDLVLVDWRMPQVDGFEVARLIRRRSAVPRIILMTAYGDEATRARAEQEGLDGYLDKPATSSSLFDAVMNAFGKSGIQFPALGPETRAADLSNLRGARVLVVEDNEFNQQVALDLLALLGVEATLAEDGQEALAALARQRFDLVLLDLQMPVMDGYETIRRIRAEPAWAGLPVLAMTAHAMAEEKARCESLGMNAYITKPLNPDLFAATLARWVRAGDPEPPRSCIDRGAGLAGFSGRTALYEKSLRGFLKLYRPRTGEVRAALDRNDRDTAQRLVHSMISAAGTIGARDLAAASRALQEAIHHLPPGAEASLLARWEELLRQVLDQLLRECVPVDRQGG